MSEDLTQVLEEANIIIVGQNHPDTIAALSTHCREDQLLLDLIHQSELNEMDAQYQGLSW